MPLWDSTGITTGVKTYFDVKSEHYGSGAGEANQATTQMDNMLLVVLLKLMLTLQL
jgi:hypothetical protein